LRQLSDSDPICDPSWESEAQMILRVLSARGLQVPAEIQRRVLSCADSRQLETWVDRAATAAFIEDVFGT